MAVTRHGFCMVDLFVKIIPNQPNEEETNALHFMLYYGCYGLHWAHARIQLSGVVVCACRAESVVKGRSHRPAWAHAVGAAELIPCPVAANAGWLWVQIPAISIEVLGGGLKLLCSRQFFGGESAIAALARSSPLVF